LNQGELIERVLRKLAFKSVDGVATGGSTTTLVDTLLTGEHTDDAFEKWWVFISSTTDAGAPKNQYRKITDYVDSTGTLTWTTAMTAAVASGDEYAVYKVDNIPFYTLLKLINDALTDLEPPLVDTSLTTSGSTFSYTLPAAVKGFMPFKVEFRDSSNNVEPVTDYEIVPTAGETADTLRFPRYQTSGLTILYWYKAKQTLDSYDDAVSKYIHDDLAVAACVASALHWRARKTQFSEKSLVRDWRDSLEEYEQKKRDHKINYPIKKDKFLNIRGY
jgi:hypothetical protein